MLTPPLLHLARAYRKHENRPARRYIKRCSGRQIIAELRGEI